MRALQRIILTLICLLILAAPSRIVAASPLIKPDIPPGFNLVISAQGVQLYRKDYPGGSPDFVEVVDLSKGAGIQLLHGQVRESRPGKGVFGGDDARLAYRSLKNYWQELSSENDQAFCVSNGQFFYMPENPTRLPFSLKVDGTIISDGYGVNDHPGQQSMLEIWSDHLDIRELNKENLYTSSAPNIIAGLEEDANKQAKHYVGRTFVGIADYDQDGFAEIFLLLNTKVARQVDAAAVLRSFSAEKVMMLDGGGSTQLICQNQWYVYSERLIPQALGIVSANGAPVMAEPPAQIGQAVAEGNPSVQPEAPAAIPLDPTTSDGLSLEPTAEPQPETNTKLDSQPASGMEPVNEASTVINSQESASDLADVAPPDSTSLLPPAAVKDQTVVQFAPLLLNADSGAKSQPRLSALEAPPEGTFSSNASLLEKPSESPQRLALEPNASSTSTQSADGIGLGDVVWVPITMSPVAALLFFVIGKMRQEMEPEFNWKDEDQL